MHKQEGHLSSHSILENDWVSSSDSKINGERDYYFCFSSLVGIKYGQQAEEITQ